MTKPFRIDSVSRGRSWRGVAAILSQQSFATRSLFAALTARVQYGGILRCHNHRVHDHVSNGPIQDLRTEVARRLAFHMLWLACDTFELSEQALDLALKLLRIWTSPTIALALLCVIAAPGRSGAGTADIEIDTQAET